MRWMENDMKTLILYTTTYGYTQEIVDEMKKRIPDATAINLQKTTEVNLEAYDSVILGGAIYVGKVHKNLIEFAKTHELQDPGRIQTHLDPSRADRNLPTIKSKNPRDSCFFYSMSIIALE